MLGLRIVRKCSLMIEKFSLCLMGFFQKKCASYGEMIYRKKMSKDEAIGILNSTYNYKPRSYGGISKDILSFYMNTNFKSEEFMKVSLKCFVMGNFKCFCHIERKRNIPFLDSSPSRLRMTMFIIVKATARCDI